MRFTVFGELLEIDEGWKRRQNARCSAGTRALSKSLNKRDWDDIAVVVEARCWWMGKYLLKRG